MSLPTLSKTWQFVSNAARSVNMPLTAQGTVKLDNARVLRTMKDTMLGFALSPWTLRYSCNSVTAGSAGDGVDRLTTDANFVWAGPGSAHSWMVLRQTGIATNYEICMSCENTSTNGIALTIVVSASAGFTGGSTTARPTATDENIWGANATWTTLASDVATRLSVMQTSDGQCTRIFGFAAGVQTFCFVFDKPTNATTGWSNPSYMFANAGSTTTALAAGYNGRMRSGSTNGNVAMGCETAGTVIMPNDTGAGAVANEISGEWPMLPIGISSNTVGVKGRHGLLSDLWMGSNSIAAGDTYPVGSNQFLQVGCLIHPWDSGTVNLS